MSLPITQRTYGNPVVTYKPTPDVVLAKFDGIRAKCGNCGRVLGEFVTVDGQIKCKKTECGAMNVVKK